LLYQIILELIILSNKSDNNTNNNTWRGQRAIGVVYNPQYEKYGNYVSTDISSRYDVFLFIDETHALHSSTYANYKR
jgi:erythromycin esterase-like protein